MSYLQPSDQQPTYPGSIRYERTPQPQAARKPRRRRHTGCIIFAITVGASLLACGILALVLAAAIGTTIQAITGHPNAPTSTPRPTPTATPTPLSQRINHLLVDTVAGASATTAVNGNQVEVAVSIAYGETFPPSVAVEICKDNAFDVMKVLYSIQPS